MQPSVLKIWAALIGIGIAAPAYATDTGLPPVEIWKTDPSVIFDATEVDLEDFQWVARPVIVFADSPNNPAFQKQLELLKARSAELILRDVVVITDTNATERSAIRTRFRPRGFMLTLVGKDGGVKLRKPFPWDVRELSRSIDKMPIRIQEIQDAKAAAAVE